jgi:hypothetical protein
MTMEQLRKAQQAKELARSAWAERQGVDFEFNTVGTGEALTPPIYFGRVFDRPPAFDYSAVLNQSLDDRGHVQAFLAPGQHLQAEYDSLSWPGFWEDPQFEVQMRWNDPVIPALNEDIWDGGQSMGFQRIHWNLLGTDPQTTNNDDEAGLDAVGWANQWLQSSLGANRWAIVEEYGCPRGPRTGRYSAKFTFDATGESRWLIPFHQTAMVWPYWTYEQNMSDELIERNIIGSMLDYNYTSRSGVWGTLPGGPASCGGIPLGVNPPNNKWTVRLEVYSTAAASIEVKFDVFNQNEVESIVNPATGVAVEVLAYDKDLAYSETVALSAGWNSLLVEYKVPSWIMPNVPFQRPPSVPEGDYFRSGWYSFKAKMKAYGLDGESVYLARATIEPDWSSKAPVPWLTVGVAEWIKDDQGMYVGAILWIKSSEVSPDCDNGVIESYCHDYRHTSAQTLTQHVQAVGLGTGDQIPIDAPEGTGKMRLGGAGGVLVRDWYLDATPDPPIFAAPNSSMNSPWRIKSNDPPPGETFHLQIAAGTAAATNVLHIAAGKTCRGKLLTAFGEMYFSTVSAGETITYTFKAKASTLTGAPQIRMVFQFIPAVASAVSKLFTLSTSYQTFVHSILIPYTGSIAAYIVPVFTTNAAQWDVGAITCEIT